MKSVNTISDLPDLQPGDILLYGDNSLLSWAIRFRTWSDVSHIEIYAGNGHSLASRAEGVNCYPLRTAGLRRIYRPKVEFNMQAGLRWFWANAAGTVYGWADLWRFYGIDVPTKGLICSQFADLFFQNTGLPLFNLNYPEGAVCPGDYEKVSSRLLDQIWSWCDSRTPINL